MATSDDVFHPDQVNDGMLYSGLAGQVAINDHIAKVSEHKQVVGGDIKDGVIFGMTIGASNPCNRGSLLKIETAGADGRFRNIAGSAESPTFKANLGL
ncbi:hypothetical protein N7501_006016 [Penicillium viridicatum]|nr:hypothetical protein N7501_006016 [Penicillium viridicatum]